jgi:hypothetical protein
MATEKITTAELAQIKTIVANVIDRGQEQYGPLKPDFRDGIIDGYAKRIKHILLEARRTVRDWQPEKTCSCDEG